MAGSANAPTLELLTWISAAPRTYAEAMEAWRSHCPRLTIWEDALADGLIRVVRDGRASGVVLTDRGRAMLSPVTSSSTPLPRP